MAVTPSTVSFVAVLRPTEVSPYSTKASPGVPAKRWRNAAYGCHRSQMLSSILGGVAKRALRRPAEPRRALRAQRQRGDFPLPSSSLPPGNQSLFITLVPAQTTSTRNSHLPLRRITPSRSLIARRSVSITPDHSFPGFQVRL